ncbi:acyltransferase family protein [Pseudomonas fluorescens]|uniref:acyltransferase family protein n=1 Tax=Pseudomonas fluorescens group TaxID=136843 RepID=UPI00177C0552|nr:MULTISPECIES: acyltransferase family protein [Pseudomonas fluorescens group]MBD8150939.1 acyltransferase family protein [Pseudomonas fluorescens]MBD8179827.1 acyltransferase family protein [Pseudomonas fluorescens]MBD8746299.1 acyltransferase family protein [Pseudomonas fluorescens]MBD8749937.1 acyltransferase family protein [Pseudomonas fluorescens]MBD8762557.1 acyltransferase family protein [Pseudomonas fluorescens]
MKHRWVQMDIAKGVGILIIVYGHSWFAANSPELQYAILASFVLPLFFFLSGVFFKPEQPFVEMAVRKADGLLKPFFFTMLAYVIVRDVLRGQPLLPDIGGVLYASVDTIPWQALWFLPHFWVAILLSWLMLRLIQRLKLPLLAACLLVGAQLLLGIWMLPWFWQLPVSVSEQTWTLPGLPFSLDVTLISSTYFICGYLLRDWLRRHEGSLLTLLISVALFAAVFLYSHDTMDLAQRRYDHWLWTSLLAVIGVYLCWALARVLMVSTLLTRVMTYIGQSTLILLIFHGEIQHKTFDLMARLGLHPLMAACVGFVVAVVVPLLIGEVIKRVAFLRFFYFPFPLRKAAKP